jgi:hypothetical protein
LKMHSGGTIGNRLTSFVSCQLFPPSPFFRYRKKKRKLFLAPENILREKQKNNFRLFFPWPVNFGLLRDHMSISAHNVMRSI